jgi:AcrR family transcriptional regulator
VSNQTTPRRSDGQRNRERLIAAASLEEIARRASLGSATLHRHFPSRYALLDAVFQDGVQQLQNRVADLLDEDDANGLAMWLEEVVIYTANNRGLAESLRSRLPSGDHRPDSCLGILREAAVSLTRRAIQRGAIRPDVSADDLLALANAISMVTEGDPAEARRLLHLAIEGCRATAQVAAKGRRSIKGQA